MRKTALAAFLVLATAGAAHAADEGNNLFISPCGEPFVAPSSAPYPIVTWFAKADANHDGKLDLAEFRADFERFFAVLDRNKDGVLDGGEISIYEHYYVPEILAQGRADAGGLLVRVVMQTPGDVSPIDPGGGGDPAQPVQRQRLDTNQGAVQFSLFAAPEPVLSADRNLDGKVSRKEFMDQADRRFAMLDEKQRGFLILADLPKTDAEEAAHAGRR
jgi:hypothetical protein